MDLPEEKLGYLNESLIVYLADKQVQGERRVTIEERFAAKREKFKDNPEAIIPDVTKDAVFRKGHIVREEDIPVLLSIGKDHIYVWEKDDTKYHEDEAADILCGICQNEYMRATDPKEGKIELIAESDGLFQVDEERLLKVNSLPEMMIATRRTNFPV